jgi:hypothetical protein
LSGEEEVEEMEEEVEQVGERGAALYLPVGYNFPMV